MIFLKLATTDPHVNLATEEYLFENSEDDVFMLWQNEPSIIIGKNQNAFAEVNFDYVREKGINVARRITGGGAVYHDLGNVNYTFITTKRSKSGIDFISFTSPIIEALRNIGIQAKLSGRNDLVIDDKKFSGNAQCTVNNRVLHHGTLLFDTELDVLSRALQVDEIKLRSKAIKSVSSRVVNLKSIIDRRMEVKDFIDLISDFVIKKFDPEISAPPSFDKIEHLVIKQRSKEWIYPTRALVSDYEIKNKIKYDFGIVDINLRMSSDKIADIKIFGDFFGTKEISELEQLLVGSSIFDINILLQNISINEYIFGISNDEFIKQIKGQI